MRDAHRAILALLALVIGIQVTGSSLTARSVRVIAARIDGILVASVGDGPGEAVLDEVVVTRTRPPVSDDLNGGIGLRFMEGATGRVADVVLAHNRSTGLVVGNPGTRLEASRVAVTRTRADPAAERLRSEGVNAQLAGGGLGAAVGDGARDAALWDNEQVGVAVSGEDSRLALLDNGGSGLTVQGGSRADLDRVLVSRNGAHGDDLTGDGILLEAEARLDGRDVVSSDNVRAGLFVDRSEARLTGGALTHNGYGILRDAEVLVELDGIRVEDNDVEDDACLTHCPERSEPGPMLPPLDD